MGRSPLLLRASDAGPAPTSLHALRAGVRNPTVNDGAGSGHPAQRALWKLACSIWSTHGNTEEKEKFRVVVYGNANISTETKEERELYGAIYGAIGDDLFGAGVWDTTCAHVARVIFLPSHNGKTPTFSYFEPGSQLDVAPYIEKAKTQKAAPRATVKAKAVSGATSAYASGSVA